MTSLIALFLTLTLTSADLTEAPVQRSLLTEHVAPTAHWTVDAVAQMSFEERAELYLGEPRLRGAKPMVRKSARLREFLADDSLGGFRELPSSWFLPFAGELFTSPRELVQLQVMVTRNLSFRGLPLDRQQVLREVTRIYETRSELAPTSLFSRREVVFAASHDELPARRGRKSRGSAKKRDMFGRSTTQRQVERQAGSFSFLQPDAPEQKRMNGHQALAAALDGRRELTFFFEGHGRAEVLQFDGKLSAKKLAHMLADAGVENAIVIASACQAHGFVRLVMEELRRIAPEQRLPIMIVPEEYGQNFVTDAFNDDFKRNELGLATGDDTLGHLFQNAHVATSVYVPSSDNLPMQVL